MDRMYLRAWRSTVLGILAFAALIFLPAGTLHYWQGWAYAAIFVAVSLAFTIYLALYDPELLRRRMQAGPSYENEPVQKVIVMLVMLAFLLLIAVSALDYRFGWSAVPWYISVVGDALVVLAFFFFYLVVRVNSFAASNVRVEHGQTVASTGPYAIVRHPMYAAALVLLIGTPLALGSWWALLVAPIFVPPLIFRILNEEEVLARDLSGYTAYQREVRYRLIPFLW